ncbi:MAG: hypothetical protein IJ668_10155 [Selenomonadaceae bacterium]|nr:hypothetical protein [Selenomonadaceae bacterium]
MIEQHEIFMNVGGGGAGNHVERADHMSRFCFDLQLFNDYNVVTIRGVINNVAV